MEAVTRQRERKQNVTTVPRECGLRHQNLEPEQDIYTMEYYTAEKNNDIMKFSGKWMELENVILSEFYIFISEKFAVYFCKP
ncbi:hypothetical protein STEG23_020861 [Scotinomys teguina]